MLLNQRELFQKLQVFLKSDLAEVTKCSWFLRADEEATFYDYSAMSLAGEGVAFEIENTFDELSENVQFVMQQYKDETFSFDKYSFKALEFIVCRYYGYLARVQLEHPKENLVDNS